MDLQANKAGIYPIYQKPAHAIGLSAPPTPPIGCVLDLAGLPGGGSKIYDRSPYGNIGTITGAVWKRLPSGLWYLDFDGSDDYVSVVDSVAFNMGTGDFTMEAWAKTNSVAAGRRRIACYETLPSATQYALLFDAQTVRFFTYISGAYGIYPTTGNILSADIWCHIVAMRKGVIGYIYVNGVEEASDSGVAQDVDAADTFEIGRSPELIEYWNGALSLVRVYNRALSALEIQNHYQQEKHLFGVW